MKRLDVICLGELLVDMISKDGGKTFTCCAGGAPANVAVACARLGLKTAFIGKVGDDQFGRFLIKTMSEAGVDVDGILKDKIGTTLAFVFVDETGERRFEFRRGADANLKPSEIDREKLAGCRIFHFGSISMICEPSRSATLKAIEVARKNGAIISFDPNLRLNLWDSETKAKRMIVQGLKMADIVKMNDEELRFLFGEDIERGVNKVLRYARRVFLTLGPKGCYYAEGDQRGYLGVPDVEVVDRTGAGDGFMGGAIYGTLKGWDVRKTAIFANAVGSLVVTKIGAMPSMPTLEEVLKFIKNQKIRLDF
ncbi:MAG: carbohydrate kinase [Candidatus Hadarchaeales archaeon]